MLNTARIEKDFLRRASMSVTVSDLDRIGALRLCPDARVVTVPNAVETESLPSRHRPAAGPLRLLFVGRLDYPPNLEAVRELVERHLPVLRREFPGVIVRIVGEESRGATEGLRREGVEFLGRVSDLLPHYAASDAAYIPLRSGGGTRLKILEAFSIGLPVASTAVGAEGLAARDGVHFRQFETPDEGAQALRDLLGDKRDGFVNKARALVQSAHSRDAALTALRAACVTAMGNATTAAR
jgi:glycosyltransferase involved in cell wall biosynthesis